MSITLTREILRRIFPDAPQAIIDAYAAKPGVLAAVGLSTVDRLAYCFANIHAETSGYTIRSLTENINYTAERMAVVWDNRFPSAAAVRAKFGTAPGWQKKAFDEIYGGRMGNRPGTSDGSTYIGRGGPQVTGRDGYMEVGVRIGVDMVAKPELASAPELQPDVAAAFWSWKGLNKFADAGNFIGCVKAWNGGTNGLAERKAQLARITKVLKGVPDGVPHVSTAPVVAANDNAPGRGVWATLAGLFKRKA